jgi:predicted alpha/beta hydrolase
VSAADSRAGLPEAEALPVVAGDGARARLLLQRPAGAAERLLYWLPAMGVSARHYLPLAQALAGHGLAVALHEWRGIGSSSRRAGRHSDWAYRQILLHDLPAGLAAAHAAVPRARTWLGGHSLGGQLACLYAGLHPQAFAGLALMASGAPYWRRFGRPVLVGSAYVLAPLWAKLLGYFPGRRLGFGGNEARGLVADWARSGRTGRYAAAGLDADLEQAMAGLALPLLALRLRDDWLGPAASLDWLLGKLPRAAARVEVLAPDDLGGLAADHFAWMQAPAPVAARIAAWLGGAQDRAGA